MRPVHVGRRHAGEPSQPGCGGVAAAPVSHRLRGVYPRSERYVFWALKYFRPVQGLGRRLRARFSTSTAVCSPHVTPDPGAGVQTLAPLASRYFSVASYSDSIVSLKTGHCHHGAVAVPRLRGQLLPGAL